MRGDLVIVAADPMSSRLLPALVIQADLFFNLRTVFVLPITTQLVNAPTLRINILPNTENGLVKPSQIMIDKGLAVQRSMISSYFGKIGQEDLITVERCLAVFYGLIK